jgi:hypothetical protein
MTPTNDEFGEPCYLVRVEAFARLSAAFQDAGGEL